MRIAIIGGGITGLTTAHILTQKGHRVTVYEKAHDLGGLAYGFRKPSWEWYIEGAYHHLFTNDSAILSLMEHLGRQSDILIKRPVTASLWHGTAYQLDSPLSLLTFPGLTLMSKFRTAALLAIFKLSPVWKPLEHITAERILIRVGGKQAFETIWKPLLYGKFGAFAPDVAASWFWARIKKRTPRLIYIRGGFHTLILALQEDIEKNNGTILTDQSVTAISRTPRGAWRIVSSSGNRTADRVLLTVPTPVAFRLVPDLPKKHPQYARLSRIPHLFAQTLILETEKPVLPHTYWLNITDTSFPFLAAVAHTNMVDPAHYGNHHLTYFGNYLPADHPYLRMTKQELLKTFLPYIKRLTGSTRLTILDSFVYTGPFAQPVHTKEYSRNIPPVTTPIPGLFLANMDFIVPWDRGTNYAVELGTRAAAYITQTT